MPKERKTEQNCGGVRLILSLQDSTCGWILFCRPNSHLFRASRHASVRVWILIAGSGWRLQVATGNRESNSKYRQAGTCDMSDGQNNQSNRWKQIRELCCLRQRKAEQMIDAWWACDETASLVKLMGALRCEWTRLPRGTCRTVSKVAGDQFIGRKVVCLGNGKMPMKMIFEPKNRMFDGIIRDENRRARGCKVVDSQNNW
jgi:hypothetical protein